MQKITHKIAIGVLISGLLVGVVFDARAENAGTLGSVVNASKQPKHIQLSAYQPADLGARIRVNTKFSSQAGADRSLKSVNQELEIKTKQAAGILMLALGMFVVRLNRAKV